MIRRRSNLGFFFFKKVPLIVFDRTVRRGSDLEDSFSVNDKISTIIVLPKMTRRRLYSRLLVVGSGSGYLQTPLHVSMFTRRQASVRKLQVFLRHTFLTFFTSLQSSNKYILVDAPHTLTQLRRFKLNVWFYFLGAACRFIYSSVGLTVPALNPSSRHGLFYL